ncbi:MAG: hypothetical protein GXX99_04840 [Clostridiales bacterium]|nr:hypothetical protein [Clostridiales bacterium]
MKSFWRRILELEGLSVNILRGCSLVAMVLLLLAWSLVELAERPCTYFYELRLCSDLLNQAGVMLFVALLGCMITDMIIKIERAKTDSNDL